MRMIKQFWGWEPWSHDSYHETPRWIFHGIWPQHFGESWVPELTKSKLPKWTNNTSNIVAYVHSIRKDFIFSQFAVTAPWKCSNVNVITMTIHFDKCNIWFLHVSRDPKTWTKGILAHGDVQNSQWFNTPLPHHETKSPERIFPSPPTGRWEANLPKSATGPTPSHEKGIIYPHFLLM